MEDHPNSTSHEWYPPSFLTLSRTWCISFVSWRTVIKIFCPLSHICSNNLCKSLTVYGPSHFGSSLVFSGNIFITTSFPGCMSCIRVVPADTVVHIYVCSQLWQLHYVLGYSFISVQQAGLSWDESSWYSQMSNKENLAGVSPWVRLGHSRHPIGLSSGLLATLILYGYILLLFFSFNVWFIRSTILRWAIGSV